MSETKQKQARTFQVGDEVVVTMVMKVVERPFDDPFDNGDDKTCVQGAMGVEMLDTKHLRLVTEDEIAEDTIKRMLDDGSTKEKIAPWNNMLTGEVNHLNELQEYRNDMMDIVMMGSKPLTIPTPSPIISAEV